MKRSARIISLLLALVLLLSGTALASDFFIPEQDLKLTQPSRSFRDTSTGAWYWDDLDTLVRAGGINGYEDGSFKPDGTLQMCEFVKILVSVLFPAYDVIYKDYQIGGQVTWYSPYVGVAVDSGILDGITVSKSTLESPMSRYDMALAITNAAAVKGEELADDDTTQYIIGDYQDIPAKYRSAVHKAYWAGLLAGKDNTGSFYGSQGLTRAEACAVVVRLFRQEDRVDKYYEAWTVQEDGGTYGLGVTMPTEWYGRFVSESTVSGDKQIFSYFCKASYNDYGGGAGLLFSVVLSDSVCDYPSQKYVGRIGYKYAYYTYPTDVQYDPNNAESAREYASMYNELQFTDAVNVVFTFR